MFKEEYFGKKEHRKVYRGSKSVDKTCRCHGSCTWCLEDRMHSIKRNIERSKSMFRDFLRNEL